MDEVGVGVHQVRQVVPHFGLLSKELLQRHEQQLLYLLCQLILDLRLEKYIWYRLKELKTIVETLCDEWV